MTVTAVAAEGMAAALENRVHHGCRFNKPHLFMAAAPLDLILILLVIKGSSFNSLVSIQVSEAATKCAYNILMLHTFSCIRALQKHQPAISQKLIKKLGELKSKRII